MYENHGPTFLVSMLLVLFLISNYTNIHVVCIKWLNHPYFTDMSFFCCFFYYLFFSKWTGATKAGYKVADIQPVIPMYYPPFSNDPDFDASKSTLAVFFFFAPTPQGQDGKTCFYTNYKCMLFLRFNFILFLSCSS